MASRRRYTFEEVEAMDPVERAAIVKDSVVTDLDQIDEHTAAMMERARPRLSERLQQVPATRS